MKKRKTKAQIREDRDRADLFRRLHDIACGAFGHSIDGDWLVGDADDGFPLEIWGATNTEGMSRFMVAVRDVFGLNDDIEGRHRSWMVGCHVLDEWATLPKLADFLYRNGIRA